MIFILTSYFLYTQVMLNLILIEVKYLHNVVLVLKNVQMVKLTSHQIPTTQLRNPPSKSSCSPLPFNVIRKTLEGAPLALVGHPSSYGITIKIPYGVDVLLH